MTGEIITDNQQLTIAQSKRPRGRAKVVNQSSNAKLPDALEAVKASIKEFQKASSSLNSFNKENLQAILEKLEAVEQSTKIAKNKVIQALQLF
jgi:uncharacterized protein Yka (UPF0111/DUF47 family)